jgi:hypothetical protein
MTTNDDEEPSVEVSEASRIKMLKKPSKEPSWDPSKEPREKLSLSFFGTDDKR